MRTRSKLAALVASAAMGVTACGGGGLDVEQDPKGAVLAAFQGAEDWSGASLTMRVLSDVDTMMAIDEGAGDMTPELARTVLDSFIRMRATAGDDVEDTADDEFELLVRVGDVDGFEVRATDGRFFLRADVPGLVETFDDSGTAMADLEEGLAEARQMGLTFLDAAVEGSWLELVGLEEAAEMFSGMTGQPDVDPSEAEQAGRAILEQVQSFVEQDVTVSYLGSDDAGERTRLTASAADGLDLVEEIFEAGGPLMQQAYQGVDPMAMFDELRREAGEDAEQLTLPVDVWIDGDTVSRVGFDLVAFAELNPQMVEADGETMPEGVTQLAIVADIEEFGGGVEVPSDPVEVNLFEIFGMFMGGLGGGFDTAA